MRTAWTSAGLLSTSPTLGSTAAERFFALSIAAARKTLYITNSYFAPDRQLRRDAGGGGPTRRRRAGADRRAADRCRRRALRRTGLVRQLLASGVRIYEWRPTTLHAKTFVIDGEWATIGSMNFDNRSLALNDEATLMVRDRTFGHQMDEIFVADLASAEEINSRAFRQRSWVAARWQNKQRGYSRELL